ncbi:Leucine Rich Repeat family protein [Trichomonas vaginalis G3]|uniref:Leucine Rich Repeat family protein n=1 Tax=Trichomonas vaginalis (strain ATCC PRA-98 / G3) TaxID=412133 RepID=A2EB06_TRIV3|nr:uncharacterized protein TVAGG3_0398040 [Trichomonas vaginalis G3]EAY10146.1 Leucine Rich Repeat family protein [Trichomonas vaginalis G3]KAI5534479.1 ribonuclease inhibitor domain-containing protein [Trichomonas vaginalis G3]|eukprot:XP_001322369.1 hypothetical protein [Trichomonas vaginalis G3]
MTDILESSYINIGKTLLTVGLAKPHLIISSKCETIIDGSKDSYCFKPVRTTIEQFSFQDNPKLTSIGSYSFYNCTNLKSIDLSKCTELIILGQYAFAKCNAVTTIILPEELRTISSYSISELSITSINIPSTVTKIEIFGICYIGSLHTITFSKGSQLKELVFNAFLVTKFTSFEVPENITKISGVAFSGVGTMTSIRVNPLNQNFWSDTKAVYDSTKTTIIYCASVIGDSYEILPTVTKINEGCFTGSRLKTINIPPAVTVIQQYAFSCQYLQNIQLPPNLTGIPNNCFTGTALTSVIIPDKVTWIGSSAFSNCYSLTYIYVPESVTSLGGSCFPSNKKLFINISEKSKYNIDKQLIVLTKDNTSITQSLSSEANIKIPSKVRIIKAAAFAKSQSLTTISFDEDTELNEIENGAFEDCTKLTSFYFGSKLQTINAKAFKNCPLSMSLSFSNKLVKIGISAFTNTKLTSLTFNSASDIIIEDNAFSNCILIQQILFICTGTISLGMNCFGGLTALQSIQIPGNIISVGTSCFSRCSIRLVTFDQNRISFSSLPALIFKDCDACHLMQNVSVTQVSQILRYPIV